MNNLKFKIIKFINISNKIIEMNFRLHFYYNKEVMIFYYYKSLIEN